MKRIEANLFCERLEDDHLPVIELTEKEEFKLFILRSINEMQLSLERMQHSIEFLSKNFPRNHTKTEFLRYHYEYFLQETYIFEQRLGTFLNNLKKRTKNLELVKAESKIDTLKTSIKSAFGPLVKRRGAHVHERRYKSEKFDQLSSLQMFSDYQVEFEGSDYNVFEEFFKQELRDEKSRLVSEMTIIQSRLEEVLEVFLDKHLKDIVFYEMMRSYN